MLKKVKGLGKSKEKDDVNHAKREHVSSNHAEDHRHKRPGQLDGPGKQNKTYNTQ